MSARPNTMEDARKRVTETGYKVDENGCWIWQGAKNGDYGRITVDGKSYSTHRLSWVFAKGDIPESMFVCHSCDNPSCINPQHLFLGTSDDNVNDMITKGRNVKGESHGCSKLTWDDVRAIRSRYQNDSIQVIAKDYQLERGHIRRIGDNVLWHDPDYTPPSKAARLEARQKVKLSLTIANEIRLRWATGAETLHGLAQEYGVTDGNIKAIVTGKIWRS